MTPEQRHALKEAYEKHHEAVFRTCLRFAAGNRQWALDRSQDVFVKLAQRLPDLTELDDLGGWLYRVAVNTSLKSLRKERGWTERLRGLWKTDRPESRGVDDALDDRREVARLARNMAALPANVRAVMTMVYLEQKSQGEAAALLGFTKGYVSKLHAKGVELLRAEKGKASAVSNELHDDLRPLREELDAAKPTPSERVETWNAIEQRAEGGRGWPRIWIPAVAVAAAAAILLIVTRPWAVSPGDDAATEPWATVAKDEACAEVGVSSVTVSSACQTDVRVQLERDRVVMAPGSTLRREKTLRLVRGRGRFEVKPRARDRQFRVAVSGGVITVVGTVFDVHQGEAGGRVDLESGVIRFDWTDDRAPQTLRPGESLTWGSPEPAVEGPDAAPELDVAPQPEETGPRPPGLRKRKRGKSTMQQKPLLPDVGSTLAHVYSLRSQKRYDEAIDLLEESIAKGKFTRRGRAELSFEIGKLLQLKGAPAAERCAHWRAHLRRYPGGKRADAVRSELAECEAAQP